MSPSTIPLLRTLTAAAYGYGLGFLTALAMLRPAQDWRMTSVYVAVAAAAVLGLAVQVARLLRDGPGRIR